MHLVHCRLARACAALLALALLVACGPADVSAPACQVANVMVAPSPPPLRVGASVALTVTSVAQHCTAAHLAPSWSSSAPSIVSVSSSGVATALTPGRSTIRATVVGVSGEVEVVVEAPVASIDVSPPSTTIVQGTSAQLVATARDASGAALAGRTVTWSSSRPAAATVTSNGVVTAITPDSAVSIVATSEGRSGQAVIRVVPPPRLQLSGTSISFAATIGLPSPAARSIVITNAGGGQLERIAAGPVRYGPGPSGWLQATLSGTSATPSAILTLHPVLAGVTPGTYSAVVPVSADAEASPQDVVVSLVVRAPDVGTVTVAPATVLLAVGAKQQMTATVRDAAGTILTGRPVQWSSTNPAVAAIDASTGLLTAASVGVTAVTATVDGVAGGAFVYTGSAGPYDGTWRGGAGSGRTITMAVQLGRVTSVIIAVGTPLGSPCALSYSASPLTLVTANAFSFSTSGGTANSSVSGTFLSGTSAQGSYGAISFSDFVCPPNLLVSGSVPGGTWTAAKQ